MAEEQKDILKEDFKFFQSNESDDAGLSQVTATSETGEGKATTNTRDNVYKVLAFISFVISEIFLDVGFYKMWAYDDSSYNPVNAYVGGDAYNYIINGTYATAFFVLTATFALMGIGFLILHTLRSYTSQEKEV